MNRDEKPVSSSASTARPDGSAFQTSLNYSEEVQILLLGAPGTGKTRLQSRYTLRQFVDIVDESAHRMGGHKYLRMLDGINVHLIIQELPASTSAITVAERRHRKTLLEKSDAVMLLFNPWCEKSFDWIDETLVGDILDVTRNKKRRLDHDIVELLDGLSGQVVAAATSKRWTLPKRSATLPFKNSGQKSLPLPGRRLDSPESRALLFPIEGGKDASHTSFRFSEPLLTSPEPAKIAPRPTTLHKIIGPLESKTKRTGLLLDKETGRRARRDSAISLESVLSSSSQYSEESTLVASQRRFFSEFEHLDMRKAKPNGPSGNQEAKTTTNAPAEESEIPVIVVATMTDRLKENGGNKERVVTRVQGQQLVRRFGTNSGYIEVSALSNANVDHAYGIIVDQVMTKRRQEHRDSTSLNRFEKDSMTESVFGTVKGDQRRAQRSCMPAVNWSWMNLGAVWNGIGRAFSLGAPADSAGQADEDVWGEKPAEGTSTRAERQARSQAAHEEISSSRQKLDRLSGRTMCHGPEKAGPLVRKPDEGPRAVKAATVPAAVRRQTTLSVYEPERYKTILRVVNPDTHEVERPPHRAVSSYTRSKLELAIELGDQRGSGTHVRPKSTDTRQKSREQAALAPAVRDATRNDALHPREPPPSYTAVTTGAHRNKVLLRHRTQPHYQQQPQQMQSRPEGIRMTISAIPPPPEASGTDITTTTTTTTMVGTENEHHTHRRVSSVSVVFRPASNYQPSAGDKHESFVLILSPSKTTRPTSGYFSAHDPMENFGGVPIATTTTLANDKITADMEVPSPPPPSTSSDEIKGDDERRNRRKATVDEALSASSRLSSSSSSSFLSSSTTLARSSTYRASNEKPCTRTPSLSPSAATASITTVRRFTHAPPPVQVLTLPSQPLPPPPATVVVVPSATTTTTTTNNNNNHNTYTATTKPNNTTTTAALQRVASTKSMASVLRYYVYDAGVVVGGGGGGGSTSSADTTTTTTTTTTTQEERVPKMPSLPPALSQQLPNSASSSSLSSSSSLLQGRRINARGLGAAATRPLPPLPVPTAAKLLASQNLNMKQQRRMKTLVA